MARLRIPAASRWALGLAAALCAAAGPLAAGPPRPDVLIVTVDTLRADHLSCYGHPRPITPNLDRLLRRGAIFTTARTVEPLTSPALASMLTSLHPHQHGGTRNGLRIRPGLDSIGRTLRAVGYRTAALVGNWTLRKKLCGLDEHFETYRPVLTRNRWLGLFRSEATGSDLTEAALEWLEEHRRTGAGAPFLLWVHYSDPHAPYLYHAEEARALGLPSERKSRPADRYATEVAFTDGTIGELLAGVEERFGRGTLVIFSADHGESLGEHGEWGHGRNLYEPGLRIPMGIVWEGRIEPREIGSPASILDLAPTLLGLLDLNVPAAFEGFDWGGVLAGDPEPEPRATLHQAHKGAVMIRHRSNKARTSGLLAIAVVDGARKEILPAGSRPLWFDLAGDPGEIHPLAGDETGPSERMRVWRVAVARGLADADVQEAEPLDEESLDRMRALGYID